MYAHPIIHREYHSQTVLVASDDRCHGSWHGPTHDKDREQGHLEMMMIDPGVGWFWPTLCHCASYV